MLVEDSGVVVVSVVAVVDDVVSGLVVVSVLELELVLVKGLVVESVTLEVLVTDSESVISERKSCYNCRPLELTL